jgi:hypothetical protein
LLDLLQVLPSGQLTGISDRLGSGKTCKRHMYQEMSWARIGEAIWINGKSDMPVLGIMGIVTIMLHISSHSDKRSKWLKSLHILSSGYTCSCY